MRTAFENRIKGPSGFFGGPNIEFSSFFASVIVVKSLIMENYHNREKLGDKGKDCIREL
jgi:hypothetical protein